MIQTAAKGQGGIYMVYRFVLVAVVGSVMGCDTHPSSPAQRDAAQGTIEAGSGIDSIPGDKTKDDHPSAETVPRFWMDPEAAEMVASLVGLDTTKNERAYVVRWQYGVVEGWAEIEREGKDAERILLNVPVAAIVKDITREGLPSTRPTFSGWLIVVLQCEPESPEGTFHCRIVGNCAASCRDERDLLAEVRKEQGATYTYAHQSASYTYRLVSAQGKVVVWKSEEDKAGRTVMECGDEILRLTKRIDGNESKWLEVHFKKPD